MTRRHYVPPRIVVLPHRTACAETGRPLPAGSLAWWSFCHGHAYDIDTTTGRRFAAAAFRSRRDPVDRKTAAAGA